MTDTASAMLEKSGSPYQIMFEAHPQPMWVYDLDSLRVLAVNDAAIDKYGYSRAEFLALTIKDLRPRDDIDALLANVARVTDGLDHAGTWRHRLKDGRIILVEITSHTLDFRGRAAELVMALDVTEQRREDMLRQSEAEVLSLIAGGAPLPQVLDRIAAAIEALLPTTMASVLVVDALRKRLVHGTAPSLPAAYVAMIEGMAIEPASGCCGTAAYRGEPVIVADVTTDPLCAAYRDLAREHGLRACWSTPVKSPAGDVLATFALYSRQPGSPDAAVQRLIPRAANLVAVAIQHTRTVESLWQSEQRFEAVAHASVDIIWDWDLATNTMWWSSGFETVLGHSSPATSPSGEDWYTLVHPDDRQRVADSVRRTIKGENDTWSESFRLRARDGRIIHGEGRGRLILGPDGSPRRFVGGLRDVSAALRDRARLDELQRRLNMLVAEAPIGILVHHDFKPILANGELARLFGYTSTDDILALPDCRVLFAPDERDRISAYGRERWSGNGSPGFYTVFGQRRDGTIIQMENRAFPIEWGDKRAICAMLTDVTDQRELEAKLRQSQRLEAVGQLTGGIAHDFNNLLTVILGNADLLSDSLAGNEDLLELAEMTRTAAERGAELTSRLLAFGRRQPLQPKHLHIDELLGGMLGLLRRTLGEHIEVDIIGHGGQWPALVDAPQLENAVLNLCINARDAMPDGGRLTIETADTYLDEDYAADNADVVPGQYVMIAISDTGAGMTSAVLARVFDPFFTTKAVGKGSGLGLSMVYGFIKQSRGHVKVYSEVGQGTTVKLYLPRAEGSGEYAEPSAAAEAAPGGTETILMVEDDALVREHVAALLTGLGYRVISTASGAEALEALRRMEGIDLLFTDVIMPGGMDGRQLANAAKALGCTMPVLFTSGYTENAIVHHGRLDAGVHLLNKPYRRQDLAAKLRQVLDQR